MTQPPRRHRLRLIAVSRRFPLTLRGFRVTPRSLVLVAVVCALSVPGATGAQQAPPPRMRREIKGLDFRKDGVWRRQARAVPTLEASPPSLQSPMYLVCRLLLEKKKPEADTYVVRESGGTATPSASIEHNIPPVTR